MRGSAARTKDAEGRPRAALFSLMTHVHTRIAVAGFSEEEVAGGRSDFLAELRTRPWLVNPDAQWEPDRGRLVVSIETVGDNPQLESEAVLDDVWDCVIACFSFSSDRISFELLEARLVSRPG